MEHLQLLLRFISGPESVENIISQGEDPTLPIPDDPTSGIFVPSVSFSEMQGKPNSLVNKDIPSLVLPLAAQPHLNELFPKHDPSKPRLFCRGHYNAGGIREEFLPSTLGQGLNRLVKNGSKVKDESSNSTIFQNHVDRSTRFFYSPTDDATMKAESSVFGTYNGSIGHWWKPITVGNNTSIALPPTAKSLLTTKLRESSKVPNNDGLCSLNFVKRVCTTTVDNALKQFSCQTCNKQFKQKCHLYRHQRKHSGVKRFFCIRCSRGFYQRSNLRAHSRTHSNDSSISHRYACTFCNRRFTRNSSLMKHVAKHSKV